MSVLLIDESVKKYEPHYGKENVRRVLPKKGMEQIRKTSLIEAAIAEIGARGTLNVTVNQIAGRAGVSSALAHHYFGGKEDLFLEAMRHTLRVYSHEVLTFLKEADTPRARLEAIVRAGFSPMNFPPRDGCGVAQFLRPCADELRRAPALVAVSEATEIQSDFRSLSFDWRPCGR